VTSNVAGVDPKHLDLLHDAVPKLARVAVMSNPTNTGHSYRVKTLQASARRLGLHVITVNADTQPAIEEGFAAMVREGAQAVVILNDSFFVQQQRQIADLALKHRLPSIFALRSHPEAGGLMSYGPNATDNFRRAASYIDKILKGAKPGDLPIQQPTRFDLVINMKTARALGLAIPKTMLFQADRVIE
jgi:putative ABC transport system substrate-binding protein